MKRSSVSLVKAICRLRLCLTGSDLTLEISLGFGWSNGGVELASLLCLLESRS